MNSENLSTLLDPASLKCNPIEMSQLADIVWAAKRSVFQVETLDSYDVAHEDSVYQSFLSGQAPRETDLAGYTFWFSMVKSAVERGVDVGRAHLLPDRLNDYLNYEIEYGYRKWCIPSGEQVYLLLKSEFHEISQAAFRDFYVIDDERVLLPIYSPENKYIGLEEAVGAETIRYFSNLKNLIRR